MSHILGTTGSSTVTTTAVQHQPSTAIITEEVTTRATSGKATSLGSGGDQQAPVISLQQREFYDHSLAVGLAGGSVSTATTIASHLQPSTEWSAPAPGHSTVGIGIGNSGEGGGGKLAPTLSTIPAFGEAQPTRATSTMLSASLYSQDAAVAVSRNWSGVTTAAPDTIPSSLGGGVNFGQNDSVGGQQHQQQPPPQQQQQQQQWFGGPGASLDPSQATATASRNPLSNMPFPSPNQHIPQPALFQAPQPHLPGASSGNGSNGATNPTVSYQYGLLPPSGQFSYIGGGGNPSGFTAGAAFGAGAIGLPTLAPQQQPPPYGVTPNIPMFAPASGFGGGLGVRGAADGGGGFILSAGTNGNVGTNSGFGSGGGAGGIIDSKPVGSQPLVEGQPAQLQLSAPMFTVSAPLQSVFMVPNGAVSGFPGAQQPRAMVHPATAAATTAAAFTVGAVVPSVPLPVNAFLQLNPLYPGLKQLLQSPPVYMVDDFFTSAECDALMSLANNYMIISPVVGAGAGEISESRTSSSCFLAREDLPTVCSKVMALTGKPLEHLELPQVGRYYTTQKYANHWDAFDLNTEDGRRFAQNGGQRVCTVLVYLNDVTSGGCTSFPRLGFRVQPKKGTAVVFFPATLDGTLDPMLLHAAEPAIDTKWVSQIWIRQGDYHGTSTARIPRI